MALWLFHSVEYHLDREALRIFRLSPDWIPAVQDGHPVKSYKKQPIVFKMEVH
jgi:protein TonB